MNEIDQITEQNVGNVIDEIHEAFWDIPFENSDFQTMNFVIGSQITPARAYRSIGLRIHSKIQALNEAKYGRLKDDIDIAELREKVDNPDTSKWDKARAEIDIQQKLEGRRFTDKLINDALHELNVLYSVFKQMPEYNRERFEEEESFHFAERLQRQINGCAGAYESLTNMKEDTPRLLQTIAELKGIENK
jgi:hypothetical protein